MLENYCLVKGILSSLNTVTKCLCDLHQVEYRECPRHCDTRNHHGIDWRRAAMVPFSSVLLECRYCLGYDLRLRVLA